MKRSGAMSREPGAIWVANPGSVGQPRDATAESSWMLLEIGADVRYRFEVVDYDLDAHRAAVRRAGFSEATERSLLRFFRIG